MRSKWKGAYVANSLINKIHNNDGLRIIKITERSSMITPIFLNKNVEIHNGKEFKKVTIKDEYIGLKFGELVHTKKIPKYKNGTKN